LVPWPTGKSPRYVSPVGDCTPPKVLSTIGYRDLHSVDEATARRRRREAVGTASPARVSGGFPDSLAAPVVEAPFPSRLPP
jgi:hypothetical protein